MISGYHQEQPFPSSDSRVERIPHQGSPSFVFEGSWKTDYHIMVRNDRAVLSLSLNKQIIT